MIKRLGTLHWRHFIIQMYVMKLEFEHTIMLEGLFQVPLGTDIDSCIWDHMAVSGTARYSH